MPLLKHVRRCKTYKISQIIESVALGGSFGSWLGNLGKKALNKERAQRFKETGDSRYIYSNKLDKACFQHDMAYRDFKDLTRRTDSDKILHDKAFDSAKIPKFDGHERGLTFMVYKVFDKKSKAVVLNLPLK